MEHPQDGNMKPYTLIVADAHGQEATILCDAHCPRCAFQGTMTELSKDKKMNLAIRIIAMFEGCHDNIWLTLGDEIQESLVKEGMPTYTEEELQEIKACRKN